MSGICLTEGGAERVRTADCLRRRMRRGPAPHLRPAPQPRGEALSISVKLPTPNEQASRRIETIQRKGGHSCVQAQESHQA